MERLPGEQVKREAITEDDIDMTFDVGVYSKELDACASMFDVQCLTRRWRLLADDAYQCAVGLSEADWEEFKNGLKQERRGRFASEVWAKKFMVMVLPEVMLRCVMVEEHFKVPFGLAFRRLKEVGALKMRDGIARVVNKK